MAKLPIRNRSKDNPYILGYDQKKEKYTVEFIDNKKRIHRVEISNKVYEAFNQFELEDVSQIHKYQRHIEHSELYDETLNSRAIVHPKSVEELVEEKITSDTLKEAVNKLSETQKRRIRMYYFEDLTLQEISKVENCSISSVKESIDSGISKLKKNIKK